MEKDKNWRPTNWNEIKQRLAQTSVEWSPSKPSQSLAAAIIEATASAILEAYIKDETQKQNS